MIFKRVGDVRPYPDHGYVQKQWAAIAPHQVRLDQLVTTKRTLDLEALLEEDSTFYGDLFAHVVSWRGESLSRGRAAPRTPGGPAATSDDARPSTRPEVKWVTRAVGSGTGHATGELLTTHDERVEEKEFAGDRTDLPDRPHPDHPARSCSGSVLRRLLGLHQRHRHRCPPPPPDAVRRPVRAGAVSSSRARSRSRSSTAATARDWPATSAARCGGKGFKVLHDRQHRREDPEDGDRRGGRRRPRGACSSRRSSRTPWSGATSGPTTRSTSWSATSTAGSTQGEERRTRSRPAPSACPPQQTAPPPALSSAARPLTGPPRFPIAHVSDRHFTQSPA